MNRLEYVIESELQGITDRIANGEEFALLDGTKLKLNNAVESYLTDFPFAEQDVAEASLGKTEALKDNLHNYVAKMVDTYRKEIVKKLISDADEERINRAA